jgi:hypothetical protein
VNVTRSNFVNYPCSGYDTPPTELSSRSVATTRRASDQRLSVALPAHSSADPIRRHATKREGYCFEESAYEEAPLSCPSLHTDCCRCRRIGCSPRARTRARLGACSFAARQPCLGPLVTLQTRRRCWELAGAPSSAATRQRGRIVRAHAPGNHRRCQSSDPHGARVQRVRHRLGLQRRHYRKRGAHERRRHDCRPSDPPVRHECHRRQ